MKQEIINSDKAPLPIGPYSQAVKAGQFIFTSGQIAIDPDSNQLLGGTVLEQAEQIFKNLSAVLEAGGSGLDRVVKTTIYLKNMNDFTEVNQLYAAYFGSSLPARSTVEVSRLPKDVLVEVDCIAVV